MQRGESSQKLRAIRRQKAKRLKTNIQLFQRKQVTNRIHPAWFSHIWTSEEKNFLVLVNYPMQQKLKLTAKNSTTVSKCQVDEKIQWQRKFQIVNTQSMWNIIIAHSVRTEKRKTAEVTKDHPKENVINFKESTEEITQAYPHLQHKPRNPLCCGRNLCVLLSWMKHTVLVPSLFCPQLPCSHQKKKKSIKH